MKRQANAIRIADQAIERAGGSRRFVIALAGPPGVGKSALSQALVDEMERRGQGAAIVPMDGFHFDNAVLEARGTLPRKGAPFTFDVDGYAALLKRLRTEADHEIAVPVFDRSLDLSRAGGSVITRDHRFLIAEGNYLLLDDQDWSPMAELFDMTVMLTAGPDELRQRLTNRWLEHGLDSERALARALSNDIPNAELVVGKSRGADLELSTAA